MGKCLLKIFLLGYFIDREIRERLRGFAGFFIKPSFLFFVSTAGVLLEETTAMTTGNKIKTILKFSTRGELASVNMYIVRTTLSLVDKIKRY